MSAEWIFWLDSENGSCVHSLISIEVNSVVTLSLSLLGEMFYDLCAELLGKGNIPQTRTIFYL